MKKVPGTRIRGNRYYLNLAVPVALRSKYGTDRLTDATGTADPKVAEEAVTVAKARFIEDAADLDKRSRLTPEQAKLLEEAGGLEGLLAEFQRSKDALAFGAGDNFPHDGEISDLEEAMLEAEHAAAMKALTRHAREEAKTLKSLGKKVTVPGGEYQTIEDVAATFAEKRGWSVSNTESMQYTMRRWREYHGDISSPCWTGSAEKSWPGDYRRRWKPGRALRL